MADVISKGVKKKWMMIVAPKEFKNAVIGESLGSNLVGKLISVSYGAISGDIRRQNVKLIFRVNGIQNNQANTDVIGYELSQGYIKRGIRTGKEKLDDSFICECKDKVKCRIKPMLITKGHANRKVTSILSKMTRDYFTNLCSKLAFTELVVDLSLTKVQKELRQVLKKTYPVSTCEIRVLKKL